MKIFFFPNYAKGNPYQENMATALEKYDARVTITSGIGKFPILGAMRSYGKPDVLHFHWIHLYFFQNSFWKSFACTLRFFLEILIAKMFGVKVVWTIHNISNHEKRNTRYEKICNIIMINLCNKLFVHYKTGKEIVVKYYRINNKIMKKLETIYHGNYIKNYENSVSRYESRNILNISEKDTLFLFFGMIRPYKGILQLVQAFKSFTNKESRLLIVGSPKNETILQEILDIEKIDQRIRIIPQYISDDQIQLYMNASDAVILPFQDVLTSGSALLAMSFGKALIVPRIGCMEELFDAGGALLYDPQEKDGLLKALQQALAVDLNMMGQYNYSQAKRFDWDMIAEKTYEVYRDCLS
jgi:glycosyltransferase involved in cell wall biosynthesis